MGGAPDFETRQQGRDLPDDSVKGACLRRWFGRFVSQRTDWIVAAVLLVTGLLFIPLLAMHPTDVASDEPTSSPAVQLDERIRERFHFGTYRMLFIAEADEGDMLTQSNLYALLQRQQALRSSRLAPFLQMRRPSTLDLQALGAYTIADAVDEALSFTTGGAVDLSSATNAEVKLAIGGLLDDPLTRDLRSQFSVKAAHIESQPSCAEWTSPAIHFYVEADYDEIKAAYLHVAGEPVSEGLASEHFGRAVQDLLRDREAGYSLYGVALDVGMEIGDESRSSLGMLIAAGVLILVIVALAFRSLRVTLVCCLGLGMLYVWVKGASNLFGLDSSIVLDVVLPIAVLVLGIDYAIHPLMRYREQRAIAGNPREALAQSMALVGRALLLAMLTTIVAFGSNVTSGIQSIVGFAIGGAISMAASFVILGVFVPCTVARFDLLRGRRPGRVSSLAQAFLKLGVAVAMYRPYLTLIALAAVTAVCAWGWTGLEARLDPADAFDPDSDLVKGLELMDEHIAASIGETAYILVEGDLEDTATLHAIRHTVLEIQDNEHVARSVDGKAKARAPLIAQLQSATRSEFLREGISETLGVTLTDVDGDGLPDTTEQLRALYRYMLDNGVRADDGSVLYTPEQVESTLDRSSSTYLTDATIILVGIPGTREQAIADASRAELEDDMDSGLGDVSSVRSYGLTGQPYIRDAQFDSIVQAMNRSLLGAAVGCAAILLVAFRSGRYALATLVPVIAVACWLHGFMYVAGYDLNIMTATIAAISVGVGIDFSIHFAERYRQAAPTATDSRSAAMLVAGSTGTALLATAVSTAAGFSVLAFAPMPVFSKFGVLTAIMIMLSLTAAVVLLPVLLLVLRCRN